MLPYNTKCHRTSFFYKALMPKKIDFQLSCKNDERTNSISLFVSLDLNVIKRKNTAMLWLRVHLKGHVIFDVIITQLIQKSHPALEINRMQGPQYILVVKAICKSDICFQKSLHVRLLGWGRTLLFFCSVCLLFAVNRAE